MLSGSGFDTLGSGQCFDLDYQWDGSKPYKVKSRHCLIGILADGAWCYDMMYSAEPTAFCIWADENGAEKSIDGLGMLVEQAAQSFQIWRGVEPDSQAVIKQLRSALTG